MLAAFWSTHHGQACTTTNAAAVACTVAIRKPGKLLLAHTHARRSTLESCLLDEQALRERDAGDFANQGMDALVRLSRSERLRQEMVPDYTWSLLREHRLDLLPGSTKEALPDGEAQSHVGEVFRCAGQSYDHVLVDVHSGVDAAGSVTLLEAADLCLVCLNQNKALLDATFEQGGLRILDGKPVRYLVSRYDSSVSPSVRDIARRYGLQADKVHPIPYSPGLMRACNTGRLYEFMLRHLENRRSPERLLMEAVRQLAAVVSEEGGRAQ